MRKITPRLVVNLEAGQWLELFLISAVGSLLITRLYLYMTGYPQIGGGGLHIAHVLFGGMLMLISITISLAYLGREVRLWAALTGGVGFGLFIDELGKFVTNDANYFFQPAIALVYIIFICIFLCFRFIEQRRNHSKQEYLLNALHLLEETALQRMDAEEKQKLLDYLDNSDKRHPLTNQLRAIVESSRLVSEDPNWLDMQKAYWSQRVTAILQTKWFNTGLSLYFIFQAVLVLTEAAVVLSVSFSIEEPLGILFTDMPTVVAWGYLLSSLVGSALLVAGVLRLRWSRIQALQLFQRSLLVNIFLTQFFAFYMEQLSAVTILFANILILLAINYLIQQQHNLNHEQTKNPAI